MSCWQCRAEFCAPAIEMSQKWVMRHVSSLFWYFALRLSNNIISYDWSNSTTETQKKTKKRTPKCFAIHFPYSTSHLGFDTCFMCFSPLCSFIRSFLFGFFFVSVLRNLWSFEHNFWMNRDLLISIRPSLAHVKFYTICLVLRCDFWLSFKRAKQAQICW